MNSIKKTVIEEYWLKKLSGDLPEISLPRVNDLKKGNSETQPCIPIELKIPGRLTDKLKKIAKNSDIGLFILVLSGLNIALYKYTGIEDLIVGTLPPATDAKQKNVFFCRNRMSSHLTVKGIINQTKQELLEAVKYSEFSLDGILDELQAKNSNGPIDIFNVAFVHGSLQRDNTFLDRFDLVIGLYETGKQTVLALEYLPSSYAGEMVERFGRNVIKLLEGMVENPGQKTELVDIVSTGEKQRLLVDFNKTEVEYPADKTIAQIFEEQAERTPDRIAVVGRSIGAIHDFSMQMTYRELSEKSRRLAKMLRNKGVETRGIVGLMAERSIEMIAGLLAVLNASGAYLPIDPGFPLERIDYMLKDSGANVLVTTGTLVEDGKMPGSWEGETIILEEDSHPENSLHMPSPEILPDSSNPAYVIYTSGTTGRPKGVMIENRSVVNFIKGITDHIPFQENDSILALTTISFDIFGLETVLPLTRGSKIVIGTEEARLDAALAGEVMAKERITIFQATPSRLHLFIFTVEAAIGLRNLNYLIVGGEALPGALLEELRKRVTGKIFNVYGPTETTIWSTIKDVSGQKPLNIGKPIANTFITILNRDGLVQPLGAVGELCITGDGVGRGYLNQPELTAKRFHRSYKSYRPHISYKTGDLARWLEDGNIECLGRIDGQVKIRGFRVELEEIEKKIQSFKSIKDAVVTTEGDGNDISLCAYIVADGEPDLSELRPHLSGSLPDYMIPSYFVQIDRIPLTSSGKVDRKGLNKFSGRRLKTGSTYVAPSTDLERIIADLWKEVLKLDEVGIHDNFFEVGGNSMKLIQLNRKLVESVEQDIPVVIMFQYLTISSIAEYLLKKDKQPDEARAKVKNNEQFKANRSRERYGRAVKRFKQGVK